MLDCIYLHGFASGPSSTKATFFSSQLRSLGFTVHVPDLNGDSFSDLTISGQLEIIRSIFASGRDYIVLGSSMGGLLASLLADSGLPIKALILFAPGFGLNRRWQQLLGPEQVQQWATSGTLDVFHHSLQRRVPLKHSFLLDAGTHDSESIAVKVPTLILHGSADEVVPFGESERFAQANKQYVELHKMDSDHNLTDCLEDMWSIIQEFVSRHRLTNCC